MEGGGILHVFDVVDTWLLPLTPEGLQYDIFRFLLILLVTFPLALMHRTIGNITLRHVFSLVVGLFMGYFLLRDELIHSIISSVVVLVVLHLGLQSGYGHKVVFVFVWSYLVTAHVHRMVVDYLGWRYDYTTPQMMLSLKLISFAINLYDGRDPATSQKNNNPYAITSFPSPLEYFSYVYFYASFLAGPIFEYKDYVAFIEKRSFPKNAAPSSGYRQMTTKLVWGVILFAVSVWVQNRFSANFITAEEFLLLMFPMRILFAYIAFLSYKFKLYSGFFLTEGLCIAAGLGYNGTDAQGEPRWDMLAVARPWEIETMSTLKGFFNLWNITTSAWLRRYVFSRCPTSWSAHWRRIVTFAFAAMWHGFYPAYYVCALMYPLSLKIALLMHVKLWPLFHLSDDKPRFRGSQMLYNAGAWLLCAMFVSHFGTLWMMLSFEKMWYVIRSVNFATIWAPVVLFAFLGSMPTPASKAKTA